MNTQISFPVYRKLPNGKSFYRINSTEHFTERQLMGSVYFEHAIQAKIYPDRLMISDMIACKDEAWLIASATEFEAVAQSHRKFT